MDGLGEIVQDTGTVAGSVAGMYRETRDRDEGKLQHEVPPL
jgi:hypothetical protein